MDILIVMCIGILVGRVSILRRAKKKNEYLSLFCTFILIFSMGVMLGKKDHFFEEFFKKMIFLSKHDSHRKNQNKRTKQRKIFIFLFRPAQD